MNEICSNFNPEDQNCSVCIDRQYYKDCENYDTQNSSHILITDGFDFFSKLKIWRTVVSVERNG